MELLGDWTEDVESAVRDAAQHGFATLVERVTDQRPEASVLAHLDAYEMAASVDFGLEAKQGLLELRSEQARLRLLARLFRAAMKRLDAAEKIAERAKGNGKVQLGG